MPDLKCLKCGGPAVRLVQDGKLSCVNQCREAPVTMARRVALEETVAATARRLGKEMPVGVGFCLVMFNYGVEGSMAYASTGERESTVEMLRELLDKMVATPSEGKEHG